MALETLTSQLSPSPAHFSLMKQDDWGTPRAIAQAANVFFGVPDIDPALGIPANWGSAKRLFINPPGGCRPDKIDKNGKACGPTFVELFWKRALDQIAEFDGELIWVAYNINQLQTLQQASDPVVWNYVSVCIPSSRVKYLDKNHAPRSGTPSASAIICVSLQTGAGHRFADAFRSLGAVWTGRGVR